MDISFSKEAWEDYLYWQKTDNKKLIKINNLIKECQRTPFSGLGKPEPLKGDLKSFWSRRIDSEHRLVYTLKEQQLIVIQCRFHY